MIDINLLRDKPDVVKKALDRKKFKFDLDNVIALDEIRRKLITEAETERASLNKINQDMKSLKKGSDEFIAKIKELKQRSSSVKEQEATAKAASEKWKASFLEIPNLPDDSVPSGDTEDDNVEVATYGDIKAAEENALPHFDIPWFSNYLDFARGTKTTGAGFPFYCGDVARLVRALIQFFLDEANKAGYIEFLPPILVNAESATATGQLPDKEGQMYTITGDNTFYLIPTAEVPVTNFYRDEILEKAQLPLNHCAYSPCFRREAGSWGAHVRGLNRLHQFDKVEVVKWVEPETSMQELENIRLHSESLLKQLDLPFRTLLMCSKDIGFPHSKQYDLEVWAGGQKRWLEVSSCSNFTDFQARRAGIRYRDEDGKVKPVHTLNGSALAIPRVLAAILENNLQPNGQVKIPDVLKHWINQDFIGDKTE